MSCLPSTQSPATCWQVCRRIWSTGEKIAKVQEVVFDEEALRKQEYQITGTEIVSENGVKVGEVADVLIGETGAVLAYEVKRGALRDLGGREQAPIQRVVSSGKDAIIVGEDPLAYPEDV